MNISSLRERLTGYSGRFLFVVMVLQPIMDVLSYLVSANGGTILAGALRTLMLFAVCLYSFCISNDKRKYLIFYGVIGGFWLLHMLNCFRLGYASPVRDAGEYLKLVQFPLWTLAFITFLRHRAEPGFDTPGLLTANFGIVLAVIAISFATGAPVYTYDIPSRGVKMGLMGWFPNHSSQSAIVSILVIGLLLWAYNTKKIWIFTLSSALGFGLLYFTGTRLAYYSAIMIALGMGFLILLSGGRLRLCCIPLGLAVVLLVLFKGASVMEYRQTLTADSFRIYQEPTDEIMGEDKDYVYGGGELPPEIEEKIARVYEDVYGGPSFAGTPLLGDLLDRFGTQRVMKAYNYTTKASVLYDVRVKKRTVMALLWDEQDTLTKFLGFELDHVFINDFSYDPETDFTALPCYYGYLGTAIYIGFAGYFILLAVLGCIKKIRNLPGFLTVELGAWLMIFVFCLGAAQLSGSVLRKPSASVYLSLAAAELWHITHTYTGGKLLARYERRAGLTIKRSPVTKGGG